MLRTRPPGFFAPHGGLRVAKKGGLFATRGPLLDKNHCLQGFIRDLAFCVHLGWPASRPLPAECFFVRRFGRFSRAQIFIVVFGRVQESFFVRTKKKHVDKQKKTHSERVFLR